MERKLLISRHSEESKNQKVLFPDTGGEFAGLQLKIQLATEARKCIGESLGAEDYPRSRACSTFNPFQEAFLVLMYEVPKDIV